jgi:hypothetical protein
MRFGFLIAVAAAAALASASALPASAGLIGDGTNTVSVNFWLPSFSVPPPLTCDAATNPNCEIETDSTNNPTPMIPANFIQGVLDGVTISVGDTQIVITNILPNQPFCSTTAVSCPDVFTGFAFSFSSGVDITSVTTDPASAADFRPIAGGLTFGPTEIFVNVVGENPNAGDKLILDVTTGGGPPPVPEPSTWALMLLGFAGLGFAGWRRMAAQTT